jgi:hypothetical protein
MLYPKIHKLLALLVCFLPASLVAGAAVMEVFIALICLIFIFLNTQNIGLQYYKKTFSKLFLIFCLFLIFSSITSEYVVHSVKNTGFYFRYGILILSIWYLLDYYPRFKLLFFYFVLITLSVVIIFSFFQIFIMDNHVSDYRISGLFGEELIQGSFLLRITPIFIIFYFYNKLILSGRFQVLFLLILILSFILIILSGERSTFFLTSLGIFLMLVFFRISLSRVFILILLFFSIFILTINLYPKSKERLIDSTFNQVFEKQNSSGKTRIYLFSEGHQNHLKTAFLIFKEHYFKGVGVRNFRLECRKNIYDNVGRYHCTTHPHNTYMQLLSETGLIGFLFFITFLVFIFRKFVKFLKIIYSNKKKLNIPLMCTFVLIFINFFPFVPTGSFFNNWMSTVYLIPVSILLHELSIEKI